MDNRSSKFIIKNLTDDDKQAIETLRVGLQHKRDEQDELLEQIDQGLDGLKKIAQTINTQLTEQNQLIDDLKKDVEHETNRTKHLTYKARELEGSIGMGCVIM